MIQKTRRRPIPLLPPPPPAADTAGTRSPERDLLAEGLEDLARMARYDGRPDEADRLEERAARVRWALP